MPKFRKKPVVIEAERYVAGCESELSSDFKRALLHSPNGVRVIRTLEGDHTVSSGDWIIRGIEGEFYPCKPHIFSQTYERVDRNDMLL
jgi:hypothetical protein